MTGVHRADARFAPSQWETALPCNDISHWLGTNLESALGTQLILSHLWHCYWCYFNVNGMLELLEWSTTSLSNLFQSFREVTVAYHKNLSGTPFYESNGSKDPSLHEEPKPLQSEGTQIWVCGPHIKDIKIYIKDIFMILGFSVVIGSCHRYLHQDSYNNGNFKH